MDKWYLIIDLKSFYASCECAMKGLDPMKTALVVADPERGRGTICLAVSPALKAIGVRNRCRVYEIPDYIPFLMAVPRMQLYLNYAAEIYGIYLDYIAKEDIFVYSVDEAFLDITKYLVLYEKTPHELAVFLLHEIERRLGLPATCGIGSNLYLAKIALDLCAKHAPDRIGTLTEASFKQTLWHHRPLRDFWRIGHGIERHLHAMGLFDLSSIAHTPYRVIRDAFGIDGHILYEHAWGLEPTTISDIRAYRPKIHSVSSGQVLLRDYATEEAEIVLKEMAEELSLNLLERNVATNSITLFIGYSEKRGQTVPPAVGTTRLPELTNSSSLIRTALLALFRRIVSHAFPIRRINLTANDTKIESLQRATLFFPPDDIAREARRQSCLLALKKRFGKNSILNGLNFLSAATQRQRNNQIGGHKKDGDKKCVEPCQDLSTLRRTAGTTRPTTSKGGRARDATSPVPRR